MMNLSCSAAAAAASAIVHAAQLLLIHLERGRRIDAAILRAAMQRAFSAPDTTGAWHWKMAYEACEAATVLFLRKYGPAVRAKAASPVAMLPKLARLASLLPTHTRRSEESQALRQFSTPIPLGLAAAVAAHITAVDRVLEPSAGTGLLAIFAELAGATLVLNELAETRAALLDLLFLDLAVTRFDAAQIDDHLDAEIVPSVVLMNPPFSAMTHVDRRMADVAVRHIGSALARLAEGGRLVAITGSNLAPDNPAWTDAFVRFQERGRLVFSAGVSGAVYARHGTTIDTRLLVIDKVPAPDPTIFPPSPGMAPDAATLLEWVTSRVPPRRPLATDFVAAVSHRCRPALARRRAISPASLPSHAPEAAEVVHETIDSASAEVVHLTDALYEAYRLQSIRIPGSRTHPTRIVQSAAMASVAPPKPSYRPHLPAWLEINGFLSDAQLESMIYAGEAHTGFLSGFWNIDDTFDLVTAARDRGSSSGQGGAKKAVRFRRGWFLGDGTGAGKGRQVAGILLDNWLKGRRRAVWVSQSDKLIEDAQRDWSALGMERLLVTPLWRFGQGTPVELTEGILFTTYTTLRTDGRGEKLSRVRQIVEWLGFDGVIIFDESHAMQNAAGDKGERGDEAPSQQDRAGLRLQMARDLKALGLYTARSLSYEGVEYELVEHQLAPEQVRIYDAYAEAFLVIHNNLEAAMRAANITGKTGMLNAQAKSAAHSAFESVKQRFFAHLLTSMKTPTLIASIEADLEAGHAVVIQIVSTGEALMERRLAEIPTEEWNDIRVDTTPREYVLDCPAHSFPVHLHEPFTDFAGHLCSRPAYRDGQPVESREAVARRNQLIWKLALITPVPGALDQIIQRFGTERVAEVTGRSRRVVRIRDRLAVETRAGSANLAEAATCMDDLKRILVFSDAGGTGRSYHAELSARNRRLRAHYLLDPGWKADTAIQGLRRTNCTNQAQPPLFRAVATNVKAEKRLLLTIVRHLDTLGAIARGQRQTGGQALFRFEDNLGSTYARDGLRQLDLLLVRGKVEGCSLERFEQATGLRLTDESGLRDGLPPITTFLGRLLALPIELQNVLFQAFEQLLATCIEDAIASGTYDVGLETLRADSFVVEARSTIYIHPATGAETRLLTIRKRDRNHPLTLKEALERLLNRRAVPFRNVRSGRAAIQLPAPGLMKDDGEVVQRVHLVGPMWRQTLPAEELADHYWVEADREQFKAAWVAELATIPEFETSTIYLVTRLLLSIWKRLPHESTRVYRLQTDAGERIIGRKVSYGWVAAMSAEVPTLTPEDAFAALTEDRYVLDLAEALQLRRVRVMGEHRIELCGFADAIRGRLRGYGIFPEITSWKLRMFVRTDATGVEVLGLVLKRFPIQHVRERELP